MAKREYPSDKQDQYMVRFPEGMRDVLKYAAAENKRSLNAEIVHRLDWTIDEDAARDRANRHYQMLERVGDGTIDPDDVADGEGDNGAPAPDYVPTALDHISERLAELAQQQTELAERVSAIGAERRGETLDLQAALTSLTKLERRLSMIVAKADGEEATSPKLEPEVSGVAKGRKKP